MRRDNTPLPLNLTGVKLVRGGVFCVHPHFNLTFGMKEKVMTGTSAKTHEGKVVSVAGDKLTTKCSEGKEHCHTMAKDAKVTCDGKASKASDLKAGTPVHVTTHKDDKTVATHIESGKNIPATAVILSIH